VYFNLIDEALSWPIRVPLNPLFWSLSGRTFTAVPLWYYFFCGCIFLLGSYLLLRAEESRELSRPVVLGTAAAVFSLSPTLSVLIYLLPICLWLLRTERPALVAFGAVVFGVSSGPLAVLGIISILILKRELKPSSQLIFFLSGLISAFVSYEPFRFSNYSKEMRVAPINDAMRWGAPLLGEWLAPFPLDYAAYQSQIAAAASRWLLGLLFVVLVMQLSKKFRLLGPVIPLVGGYLFLTLEGLSSAAITRSLASYFYGLASLPLPNTLAIFGLALYFLVRLQKVNRTFLATVLLLGPIFPSKGKELKGDEFFSQKVENFFSAAGDALNVPSPTQRVEQLVPPTSVESNVQGSNLLNAIDGDSKTRWSTGLAQKGGETFSMKFDPPRVCRAISFSPGSSPGDYPRGLKATLLYADGSKGEMEFNRWQGALSYRGNSPHFTKLEEVELHPKPQLLSTVILEQLANDPFYFWSIADAACEL